MSRTHDNNTTVGQQNCLYFGPKTQLGISILGKKYHIDAVVRGTRTKIPLAKNAVFPPKPLFSSHISHDYEKNSY